jgi:uncharacterized protein (DUF2237 family)
MTTKHPAYFALPPDDRRWCVLVAQWEAAIEAEANYILGSSIRHPHCEMRAAAKATDLAVGRRAILDEHPAIGRAAIDEVRGVLEH